MRALSRAQKFSAHLQKHFQRLARYSTAVLETLILLPCVKILLEFGDKIWLATLV